MHPLRCIRPPYPGDERSLLLNSVATLLHGVRSSAA